MPRLPVIAALLCVAAAARGDEPKWSPDGLHGHILAYAVDEDGPGNAKPFGTLSLDLETGTWPAVGPLDLVGATLSHDGRYLAGTRPGPDWGGVWVYDLSGKTRPRRVHNRSGFVVWAGPAATLVFRSTDDRDQLSTFRVNPDGSGLAKLPVPDGFWMLDASANMGRLLLAPNPQRHPDRRGQLYVMPPNGTDLHPVLDVSDRLTMSARISPDGLRVVYPLFDKIRPAERTTTIWSVNADGKGRAQIPIEIPHGTQVRAVWSPDGTRLAVGLSSARQTGKDRIVVLDSDGKNPKKLPFPATALLLLDWK